MLWLNDTCQNTCTSGQRKRYMYLSHQQAVMAQASLRINADLPEPSLLAYTKYGSK